VSSDSPDKPPPEFMSALVTEHFVLQGTSSSTISESGSRVAVYLSALSSGLAFTILPTVFVLGWFTIVRLIDTSVANVVSQRRMDRIKAYYTSLYPPGVVYFEDDALGNHGVQYGRWSLLFTMASMVIVVNSVVGGAAIALLFALPIRVTAPVPVVLGLLGGLLVLGLSLVYEHRRLTHVVLSSSADFYVSARGLTTSLMPVDGGGAEIEFNFIGHELTIPRSVADFYAEFRAHLAELGIDAPIGPMPNEVPDAIPFAEDSEHNAYDAEAIHRTFDAASSLAAWPGAVAA
jgi:Family of unknown function (DUF5996)